VLKRLFDRNAVLLVICLLSHPAWAQQIPLSASDPVATAPVQFGAFALDPKAALSNLGWDTNVFNDPTDPKQDFTFTITPAVDLWMRTQRGLLTVNGAADLVYFHEYDSQGGVNSRGTAQYEFGFNRLRPYGSARTLNTRDQPGFEIEARVRRYETEFQTGIDVRVASKSSARLNFRQIEYTFAGDEIYNGRPLNEELNRTLKGVNVDWRQRLTALTTWIVRVSSESERFQFEQLRNSDSFRLSSGFELGRFALIRGAAFLGYRHLTPADGGVIPEFSGLTADVNVSYNAPYDIRLGGQLKRDIEYSYESGTPYYVQSSWTTTLTKRVVGRWDVQFSGGQDFLDYQFIVPETIEARTDKIGRFGGGVGYTLGDDVRMAFDVNSYYRSSVRPGRDYGTIRGGFSVTYGY
jgi:hypothetical protein